MLIHPSVKMFKGCANILSRTRNNPKEPLITASKIPSLTFFKYISVLRFRFFYYCRDS